MLMDSTQNYHIFRTSVRNLIDLQFFHIFFLTFIPTFLVCTVHVGQTWTTDNNLTAAEPGPSWEPGADVQQVFVRERPVLVHAIGPGVVSRGTAGAMGSPWITLAA